MNYLHYISKPTKADALQRIAVLTSSKNEVSCAIPPGYISTVDICETARTLYTET